MLRRGSVCVDEVIGDIEKLNVEKGQINHLQPDSQHHYTPATNNQNHDALVYKSNLSRDTGFEPDLSSILSTAVAFKGIDKYLGNVVAIVYKKTQEQNLSAVVVSKLGHDFHKSLNISPDSKYRPAILNLSFKMQNSRVRKSLAVALLKSFGSIIDDENKAFDWDETNAGRLASKMSLINESNLSKVIDVMHNLGMFSNEDFDSYIVDVLYQDQQQLNDSNNAMAFLLGNQLDQLFDPLTEYSPEPTERAYKPPIDKSTMVINSPLIDQICQELITVQTNFTTVMVNTLQKFIVPLRIVVLEGQISNYTTSKLNQFLPPTIDEVTRINCIFLDMLKLAQPFGAYEMLKACGTTIPYFYKALMRNQAATKNFRDNFIQLCNDLKACGKENLMTIHKKDIDAVVHSSLHLTKLRLIIHRLFKSIDWNQFPKLKQNVDQFVQSCDNTISSFANDTLKPYNNRIFTPTGKILAEVAKGWPLELQYGWLTRRVVAVFDATDLLSNDISQNRGVIIIFSDHILFLSITDDNQYYKDYWQATSNLTYKPSVSDILMHSLTNETPFNNLPNMKVKNWIQINDVDASHYRDNFIKFFDSNQSDFFNMYQLDHTSGKHLSETIARSKILNKSQSFHLFMGNSTLRNLYYVTHNNTSYHLEESKSPVLVLLNTSFNPNDLLQKYPQCQCILTLNFSNENNKKIVIDGLVCSSSNKTFQLTVDDSNLEFILTKLIISLLNVCYEPSNKLKSIYISKINEIIMNKLLQLIDMKEGLMLKAKNEIIEQANKARIESDIVLEQSLKKTNTLDVLEQQQGLNRSNTTKVSKLPSKDRHKKRKSSIFSIFSRIKSQKEPYKSHASQQYQNTVYKQPTSNTELLKIEETPVNETEGSIYVNSKFEFPMEENANSKENNEPLLKGVRYAKLNDFDGSGKGYKDSIDLMAKLEISDDKESSADNYDDLFDITNNNMKLEIPKNSSPKKQMQLNENVPNSYEIPKYTTSSKNKSLKRSDSYYVKFQKMRSEQEKSIQKNGISDISALSNLNANTSITSKLLLSSPSVNRKLSSIDSTDDGSDNWIQFGSNGDLTSIIAKSPKTLIKQTFQPQRLPVSNERVELITKNNSIIKTQVISHKKAASVKLISSSIVRRATQPIKPKFKSSTEELNSFLNSATENHHTKSSSIYEFNTQSEVGELNNTRNTLKYGSVYTPYDSSRNMNSLTKIEAPYKQNTAKQENDINSFSESSFDFFESINLSSLPNDSIDLSKNEFNHLTQPHLTHLSSETINESPVLPEAPSEKDYQFVPIIVEPLQVDITQPDDFDTSLCSVLKETAEVEMLMNIWSKGTDASFLKRSETMKGLESLLKDKSYAYLNAVLNESYLDKNLLVRDPTHWNLTKF